MSEPYREITEEQRQRMLQQCERCLAPIRWSGFPGSWGTRPPLEEAGFAFVITAHGGTAMKVMTYRLHECSGQRPVDESTGEVALSDAELRAIAQKSSLTRVCPKCRAFVGEPCVNLARKDRPPTRWPHEERLADG